MIYIQSNGISRKTVNFMLRIIYRPWFVAGENLNLSNPNLFYQQLNTFLLEHVSIYPRRAESQQTLGEEERWLPPRDSTRGWIKAS